MARSTETLLRDQGRGVVGALIVSVELLFTMEMWWHGWQLPSVWLVVYAVVGLLVVLAITRYIGFREEEEQRQISIKNAIRDFMELLLQSVLTAYIVLLVFGIIDFDDSLFLAARLGLLLVVPLGFGAALANSLLKESEKEQRKKRSIYRRLGVLTVGAAFVSMTMAPTDEMPLMAAYASWQRLGLLIILSVLVAYLTLFELEFRGHASRIAERSAVEKWGYAFVTYTVGIFVAAALLASFGQFQGTPIVVWVQMVVVLGFPSSLGASGARVVLG